MTDVNPGPLPADWRAFRTRLLGWVRPRVSDPADAEDLVQDILATANVRLASLRSPQRLVPWLDAIARNALVDYYRRRGRAPETVGFTADVIDAAHGAVGDGESDRVALTACVRPMLEALPAPYREAVTRVDLDGESCRLTCRSTCSTPTDSPRVRAGACRD
jgi:RNA polymerase sigma-70 factor (ECF subfamily)